MNSNQTALYTLASLLAQGKQFDRVASAISVAALVMCLLMFYTGNFAGVWVVLSCSVLGLFEKYYAIRVGFDVKLFYYLAIHAEKLPEKLQELDESLLELGLIKQTVEPRSLKNRQQGALALLKKQILCCVIQVVLLMVAFLWVWIIN